MNIQGSKKFDYQCNGEIKIVALRVSIIKGEDQEYSGIKFIDKDEKVLFEECWGTQKHPNKWEV